jgi:hypothetical protein
MPKRPLGVLAAKKSPAMHGGASLLHTVDYATVCRGSKPTPILQRRGAVSQIIGAESQDWIAQFR